MIFISGGVRSGKSHYAEKKAIKLHQQKKGRLFYVATSQYDDEEMKKRIEVHKQIRLQQEVNWQLIEQPFNLERLFPLFKENDVIVVDCFTTLLNNELFKGWQSGEQKWKDLLFRQDLFSTLKTMVTEIGQAPWTIVFVSNEIGYESLEQGGTIVYAEMLGKLHQEIVLHATEAILIESGIPVYMKKIVN